jgi:hypothetical protein
MPVLLNNRVLHTAFYKEALVMIISSRARCVDALSLKPDNNRIPVSVTVSTSNSPQIACSTVLCFNELSLVDFDQVLVADWYRRDTLLDNMTLTFPY